MSNDRVSERVHIAHTAYHDTRIGVQANMSLTDRKIEGIDRKSVV